MNTFGRSEKTFRGGLPVWIRVDGVMPCGGTVDLSSLAVGDMIPAGSMVSIGRQGGVATIVKSDEADKLSTVVGLTKNDIYKEHEGITTGTVTVVYAGVIMADRVDVPDEVQALLPRITFVKETE